MTTATGSSKEVLKEVTKDRPCAVCGKGKKCKCGNKGLILCGYRRGPVPGFVYMNQAKGDDQFAQYRAEDDPLLREREDEYQRGRQRATGASGFKGTATGGSSPQPPPPPPPEANGHADDGSARPSPIDWEAKAREFVHQLTPALRAELAGDLGLPVACLDALPLLGFNANNHDLDEQGQFALAPCWTFPEEDGAGRVIGLLKRHRGGRKKAMTGSARGLIVPSKWREYDGPIYLPEGPSDVLAGTALGLCCVGRPSNTGGVDHLAGLLGSIAPGRPIIVLGEYDPKPDGKWPGLQGATETAAKLAAKLGQVVFWAMPPDGEKDLRKWVQSRNPDPTCADEWHDLGDAFGKALKLMPAKPGQAATEEGQGLATTSLTDIRPEPVRWLVEGLIPLGKLTLLAGDGGHGKTTLTLELAAGVSAGRAVFGIDYTTPAAGEVLLISCEDDFGDTVVPRLLALGADLSRIRRVDGLPPKDDKTPPFTLAHYEALERELKGRPGVRLVVIDPAGAYIGKAGCDDHKDSELRALLGPLAELAARCQVAIILVKHLNKGATVKAVNKVSGSTGYVNTVRAAFLVTPDPADDAKKLLLPLKFNCGPKPQGLAYCLKALGAEESARLLAPFDHLTEADRRRLAGQLFRPEWLGRVEADADTVVGEGAKKERGPTKAEKAAEWLKDFLGGYAWPSEEVLAAGGKAGHAKQTIWDGKKLAGVGAAKEKGKRDGAWLWGIGTPAEVRNLPLRPKPSDTSNASAGSDTSDGSHREASEASEQFEPSEGSVWPESPVHGGTW
jgi:hypothetical protein